MTTATLTREQILALPAGREMDALVAEKVFGLVPCTDPLGYCEGAKTTPCQCWGTGGAGTDLLSYSTDIAAAWQVVEKLCPDGSRSLSLHRFHSDGLWYCEIGHRKETMPGGTTAPLAICRAALLATLDK